MRVRDVPAAQREGEASPPSIFVGVPAPDPIFPLPEPGKVAYLPVSPAPVAPGARQSAPIVPAPTVPGQNASVPNEPAIGVPPEAAMPVSPSQVPGRVVGVGQASWYGPGFHGRRTASGEVFNENALTAAHRTLPFGSRVQVINQRTGGSVVVRINDRGPHVRGRIIDLSRASARMLGIGGAAPVRLVRFGP